MNRMEYVCPGSTEEVHHVALRNFIYDQVKRSTVKIRLKELPVGDDVGGLY